MYKNPTKNILPEITSAAITGVGLGIEFKGVDWASKKLTKSDNPNIVTMFCNKCGYRHTMGTRIFMRHYTYLVKHSRKEHHKNPVLPIIGSGIATGIGLGFSSMIGSTLFNKAVGRK